jgi:hypothetical protein
VPPKLTPNFHREPNSTVVRKSIISIFLLCYIYAIGLSLLPVSPVRNALFDPIRPLLLYSGLWENFIVFAPNPPMTNVDLTAKIQRRNGETIIWQYPRMDKLSILDRIEKERYRKFGSDHLNYDAEVMFRPDLARFVARLYRDDDNPPQTITLQRHWADIPAPPDGIGKPLPEHNHQADIFTYTVRPDDMQ